MWTRWVIALAIGALACTAHAQERPESGAAKEKKAPEDPESLVKGVAPVKLALDSLTSPHPKAVGPWQNLKSREPNGRSKVYDVPSKGYLRVSLSGYDVSCRKCRCGTHVVLTAQKGRRLTLELAPVNSPPSVGLCRAMPMVDGSAILGPIEPGAWRLASSDSIRSVSFQPIKPSP